MSKSLDDQLAALSADVAPPPHLWQRIAGDMARKPRAGAAFALAASLCAVLAGAIAWAMIHGRAPHDAGSTVQIAASFSEPGDAKYAAARHTLETTFRDCLTRLDPTTRAHIEASLAVIRRAHEDIRKALAAEPDNPVLEQLFESTWHDELDLYDHVVRATQPTLRI